MRTVYVLIAKWSDNSGVKVIRVYSSQDKALEALEVARACEPAMNPEIIEVPYVKGDYE